MLAADAAHRLAQLVGQVEVDRLDAHPAAPVDAAHVEQVVDEATHAPDLRANDAQVRHLLALTVVLAHEAPLEQLRVALDAGQRRAQLVADDREEVVLDPRRGLLASHALLEVGPQLRVLERRPGALRDRLGHPRDPLLERAVAASGGGEDTLEAATCEDRDRHEPVHAQRAHPVGIAGLDLGGGGLAGRGRRADGADQPVAQPRVTSIGERTPRLDQLAVGTGGRCGREAVLDVVHREDEGRAAEHRGGPDRDRLERGLPLERGAEVAAEPAEQLALARLLALALLLDELGLEPRVLLRAADDDAAEEAGHDAEADEVGDPHRQRFEARRVQPISRKHDREVHAGHDER